VNKGKSNVTLLYALVGVAVVIIVVGVVLLLMQ